MIDFISNLRCPITGNRLILIEKDEFSSYKMTGLTGLKRATGGLTDESRQYFYPVFDEIIILHEHYALFTGNGNDLRGKLSPDKKRVFDYYNEIDYKVKDSFKIYEDSAKWVDYREISSRYMRTSFSRASRFFPSQGKYLLDIASGPIGLEEYMALSDGYDYRVCVDISINALLQARNNLEKAGKKGIFICADITNIPINDNVVDTVLCQHTLYHVPRKDQETAVNEMYRVAKRDAKIVIIYSWFYHSWFMNISLNVVQLYRIARHFAGKLYVRLLNTRPRLYFYAHSPRWFRNTFSFGKDIEFYCWRSTNKYFMNLYIHKSLFGAKILERLMKIEDTRSKFMSRFGEYAAIVITKK
jgi:ubiquinone/menaquinone biosynthesis C-methylase UbiE